MATQIVDAVVEVNNDAVGIVPNSLSFNEGLGEQRVLAVSEGNGQVSQVFSNDLESAFGMVRFSLRSTAPNIAKIRQWKANGNTNVVIVAGQDREGNDFIRTFTQAAIVTNYDVNIGTEGTIDVEFQANSPV